MYTTFPPLIIASAQPVSEKDHININPYYRYNPELTNDFYQKKISDWNKERIHRKSFIAIDKQNFGLDKYAVYYAKSHNGYQIIIGADSFSFRLITSVGANLRESSFGHYSRDDNYVFHGGDKINSADPATFEVLGRNYGGNLSYDYAIDKNHVFDGEHILVGADPNTFNPISDKFSVDVQHIFVNHKLIKGSDSQTYKRIDEGYSKDKNQVYFNLSGLNSPPLGA